VGDGWDQPKTFQLTRW